MSKSSRVSTRVSTKAPVLVVAVVLLGLLAMAVYVPAGAWAIESETGQSMSATGYVAMTFGFISTLALLGGLLALMTYGSRQRRG